MQYNLDDDKGVRIRTKQFHRSLQPLELYSVNRMKLTIPIIFLQ